MADPHSPRSDRDALRGSDLPVRVFPEQMMIDTHEPRLSRRELESGRAFRAERAKGNGRDGWRALAQRFGPERAAWLASTVEAHRDDDPPEVRLDDAPWLVAHRLPALPERFVVYHYRGEDLVRDPVAGRPIAQPLTMVGDPAAGNRGLLDDASDWVVNFSRAEDVGIGIRVPGVSEMDRQLGFSRVVVIGIRPDDATAGQRVVEALLENHHYSTGLGFVPWGTPTNNTESTELGALGSDRGPRRQLRHRDRQGTGVGGDGPSAHERAAAPARAGPGHHVGGLAPSRARGDTEDAYTYEFHTAPWPATGDYLLRYLP
jgi:hypothetical protein